MSTIRLEAHFEPLTARFGGARRDQPGRVSGEESGACGCHIDVRRLTEHALRIDDADAG